MEAHAELCADGNSRDTEGHFEEVSRELTGCGLPSLILLLTKYFKELLLSFSPEVLKFVELTTHRHKKRRKLII